MLLKVLNALSLIPFPFSLMAHSHSVAITAQRYQIIFKRPIFVHITDTYYNMHKKKNLATVESK